MAGEGGGGKDAIPLVIDVVALAIVVIADDGIVLRGCLVGGLR